jgi:hypothetical protein
MVEPLRMHKAKQGFDKAVGGFGKFAQSSSKHQRPVLLRGAGSHPSACPRRRDRQHRRNHHVQGRFILPLPAEASLIAHCVGEQRALDEQLAAEYQELV